MSKLTSYRKVFTPQKGPNLRDNLSELLNSDFGKYIKHMEGTPVSLSIEPASLTSEKEQMYAYYQKVVLSIARDFFYDQGFEGMDKYKADELLKTHTAKDYMVNTKTGEKIPYLKPKKRMPKEELRRHIESCIHFLAEYGYEVPESFEYKVKSETGIGGFQELKSKRK